MSELSRAHIQAISSADGVEQFLARIGYDVSNPADQTAAGLGIAERVHHAVQQVRRVASHSLGHGLPAGLEVYWFEAKALTADLRKAAAAAFRNKPACTLLLMTTRDFASLDFVLVERALAESSGPGSGIAVSHRLMSVDRHNPADIHLRALERMRYLASDPYAQFDRIRDAFKLAEWSEPEFNNRNLFSDHFLKKRITDPNDVAWSRIWSQTEPIRAAQRALQNVFERVASPQNLPGTEYIEKFIHPILAALNFEASRADRSSGQPDFILRAAAATKDSAPLAALLVYPWDRPLDRKDDHPDRDAARAEDVPGIRVVNVLEQHKLDWAILTNGKDWRLYCGQAHSRASNYYEVDLPAILESEDLVAFRYFDLFFRAEAFAPTAVQGVDTPRCFLDRIRAGSVEFAKEVGKRLRERVFDEVFPYLAQGFVDHRKEKAEETTKAGDPFLHDAYDATLTLLYRLLFLLYAESLDLVPVHEPAYATLSLRRMKIEIAEAAGVDSDAVEERLKKKFNRTDTDLYQRLAKLFEIIDTGSAAHNMPAYNGGLFRTTPDKADTSREAAAARFLKKHRVPDFFLARAIDLLARDEDTRANLLVNVDYKALGVRQLGSIYEGLLMYHAVIPKEDWEKEYQRPGLRVALVPSNEKRKSTGSYYTPEHIVKYIVANTVGPLLTEKFAAAAPKMREAQRDYAETRKFERDRAARVSGATARSDDAIAGSIMQKYESAVWNLFDLKVLDPAMGSAHFLVETVDFITDKVLDFLAGFPWNPVQVLIEQRIRRQIIDALDAQGVKINEDRLTDVNLVKRLVMKRCVYGVDLNPMAVELAKVSLWLDSFTLGAPLSFLDHHLKCGNSLIGSTIADLKKVVAESGSLFAIPMEPLERATRNMELIADLTDATLSEVTKSADTYRQVLSGVTGYRALLDCLTAEHFGVGGAHDVVVHAESLGLKLDEWDRSLEKAAANKGTRKMLDIIRDARRVGDERRFLHWDLSFPDVFFTARRESERRAFDAVIGNPPYGAVSTGDSSIRSMLSSRFEVPWDWYPHFMLATSTLVHDCGRAGMIVPQSWQTGPAFGTFRRLLAKFGSVEVVINLPFDVFVEAYIDTCVYCQDRDGGSSSATRWAELPKGAGATLTVGSWTEWQIAGDTPPGRLADGALAKMQAAKRMRPLGTMVRSVRGVRVTCRPTRRKADYPVWDGDAERYASFTGPTQYASLADIIEGSSDGEWYEGSRVWVRRIVGRDDRILCVRVTQDYITKKDFYILKAGLANDQPLSPLLAVVNSSAVSRFAFAGEVSAGKDDFRQLSLEALRAVPVPSWASYDEASPARLTERANAIKGLVTKIDGLDRLDSFERELFRAIEAVPQEAERWPDDSHDVLGALAESLCKLGEAKFEGNEQFKHIASDVGQADLGTWTGLTTLSDLDYLGWDDRFPAWQPDGRAVAEGRWFPNAVAPPIDGEGPGGIPWDLIARVYPSYPLPGIDADAWEAAAWEEFCDLLRKNKNKIGNKNVTAQLTGRGAVTNPTGPMKKLHETFLKYHRDIRANRARAAEIDFLIDRIVFRLFDLTLDEQKLILSRVGPGRPLPPRRGRRKARAAEVEGGGLFEQEQSP